MSDNKASLAYRAAQITANKMIGNQRSPVDSRDQYRQVTEFFRSTDTKHDDAWASYGYKNQLEFIDFYTMHERFGIANAAVNMTVDKCWQTYPRVVTKEDEHEASPWEKEFQQFCAKFDLWPRLKGLDWRQRISRYAGLIMFVSDGQPLNKPLITKGKKHRLENIKPVLEGQLYPTQWEEDTKSIRYGEPILYQFNEQVIGDKNLHSGRSVNIHYTRVITWAEGADDGTVYGRPALEPVFNSLVTLERLIGAGGTGYWKAARQSVQMAVQEGADLGQLAQMLGVPLEGLKDALEQEVTAWQRGFDSVLALQGIEVNKFDFNVPDPDKHFAAAASDVAAGMNIPMTILIGQQTGRLASDEDQSDWSQANESRRSNFVGPAILKTIRRFMELGFISQAQELFVQWDPLQEPSPKDKLERAELMAKINQASMGTGQLVFTTDEIRAEYGLDPIQEDIDFPEGPSVDDDE